MLVPPLSKWDGSPIMPIVKNRNDSEILADGREVLQMEADALLAGVSQLDQSFCDAIKLCASAIHSGHKIIVSGVGKSGIVAQKVAATLTSTGSLAIFLHPTEALHGDLGVLRKEDVFVYFSNSGSTEELLHLLPVVQKLCSGVIGIVGNRNGVLAKNTTILIGASIPSEACPNNLAPTSSSTLQMAIGDALAMSLSKQFEFSADHYAQFHPGGALGKRLHSTVADLMQSGDKIALIPPDAKLESVVLALTDYRQSGVSIVEQRDGRPFLVGVITERDIRLALLKREQFFELSAADIMTKNPLTVRPETKASDALELIENREHQLSFLPVVDSNGFCVGVLRVHDLVLAGLA